MLCAGVSADMDLSCPGGYSDTRLTSSQDPRNFTHPDEFIPERWTSRPELVKNATVNSPFSIGKDHMTSRQAAPILLCFFLVPYHQEIMVLTPGPGRYACVGKQLSLMEVRRVTTMIARNYDIAMAPGQTKEAFLSGLQDNFTLATPKLDLVFSPRKGYL